METMRKYRYPRKVDEQILRINDRLLENNEMIEEGGFAQTFYKRNNPKYISRVSIKDYGYQAFLIFEYIHRGNPHLPVIVSYISSCDNTYTTMERLEHLSEYEESKFRKPTLRNDNLFTCDELNAMYMTDDLRKLIADIRKFKKHAKNVILDFKPDNVMKRGNMLIITDPYLNTKCLY